VAVLTQLTANLEERDDQADAHRRPAARGLPAARPPAAGSRATGITAAAQAHVHATPADWPWPTAAAHARNHSTGALSRNAGTAAVPATPAPRAAASASALPAVTTGRPQAGLRATAALPAVPS